MEIEKTDLPGLLIFKTKVYSDSRGSFQESYNQEISDRLNVEDRLNVDFVQENQSISHRGVLRGLHFQRYPHAQGKLVRVVTGSVLDVSVDLRKNSPTFTDYLTIKLSGEDNIQLYVPEGFAHGFLSLEDNTIFQYKCTNHYNSESESGIIWNDSQLRIHWESDIKLSELILSKKDAALPKFNFENIYFE